MAQKNNTSLIVGVISFLVVGTTIFFIVRKIKNDSKNKQLPPTEPEEPTNKKTKKPAQIYVGDTINAGIGQPNEQWDSVLKLGETVKNWFGGLGTKPVTFQTEGLAPINPTQIKNINIKSELKKSLNAGYKTK
jgi:hypothetical protein